MIYVDALRVTSDFFDPSFTRKDASYISGDFIILFLLFIYCVTFKAKTWNYQTFEVLLRRTVYEEQQLIVSSETPMEIKACKTMKSAKFDHPDKTIYPLFIQATSRGIPLSSLIIMIKVVEMNRKLEGDPTCKASVGWLDSLCSPSSLPRYSTTRHFWRKTSSK